MTGLRERHQRAECRAVRRDLVEKQDVGKLWQVGLTVPFPARRGRPVCTQDTYVNTGHAGPTDHLYLGSPGYCATQSPLSLGCVVDQARACLQRSARLAVTQ